MDLNEAGSYVLSEQEGITSVLCTDTSDDTGLGPLKDDSESKMAGDTMSPMKLQ